MSSYQLEDIRIATPCDADWEGMVGDDRKRFCGSCQKSVFNISDMGRVEAEKFLEDSIGKSVCVQLYKRHDGTVITDDCPVGLRKLRDRLRLMKASAALFLSFILSALFSSVKAQGLEPIRGKMQVRPTTVKGERVAPSIYPVAGGLGPPALRGDMSLPPPAQATLSARIVGSHSKWTSELKACNAPALSEVKLASPNKEVLSKTSHRFHTLAKKCSGEKHFEMAAISLNNAANCELYAGNYNQAMYLYKEALAAVSKADKTITAVLRPTISENIFAADAASKKSVACGPGIAWLQTELGGASYTAAPSVVSSGVTEY